MKLVGQTVAVAHRSEQDAQGIARVYAAPVVYIKIKHTYASHGRGHYTVGLTNGDVWRVARTTLHQPNANFVTVR